MIVVAADNTDYVNLWKAAHDALFEYHRLCLAPMTARSALDRAFAVYRKAHDEANETALEAALAAADSVDYPTVVIYEP